MLYCLKFDLLNIISWLNNILTHNPNPFKNINPSLKFEFKFLPPKHIIHKDHVNVYNDHSPRLFLNLKSERNFDHFKFLFGEKFTHIFTDECMQLHRFPNLPFIGS